MRGWGECKLLHYAIDSLVSLPVLFPLYTFLIYKILYGKHVKKNNKTKNKPNDFQALTVVIALKRKILRPYSYTRRWVGYNYCLFISWVDRWKKISHRPEFTVV